MFSATTELEGERSDPPGRGTRWFAEESRTGPEEERADHLGREAYDPPGQGPGTRR